MSDPEDIGIEPVTISSLRHSPGFEIVDDEYATPGRFERTVGEMLEKPSKTAVRKPLS
jgi:hypothetical protein